MYSARSACTRLAPANPGPKATAKGTRNNNAHPAATLPKWWCQKMGATSGMIRRIFMFQGTIIGVIGTLLGYALGLSLGWLLKRYQFIKLPENVYTLDHLPIIISLSDVLIIGASAMLLCFLATLYPARQASRLQPAEALRYE